jgi:hypothetical protein
MTVWRGTHRYGRSSGKINVFFSFKTVRRDAELTE